MVDGVEDKQIDDLVAEYGDTYDVQADLLPSGDRHDSLRYGARVELGMRSFLTDGDFTAFTTNFEDLGGLRQLPGLAVQRLMADGYGFGGEGDWKTSVMLRTLKVVAEGLPGGTSFMEDYTYHLVPGEEKILGAHARGLPLHRGGQADGPDSPARHRWPRGPGPSRLRRGPRRRRRPRCRRPRRALPLRRQRGHGRTPDQPLPNLPVARAVWRPEPNLRTSTEAWLTAGGPHHTVLSTALTAEHLDDLAEMTGTELVLIDADTTVRSLIRELRWNAAYHRLAAGL